jgi:hypothetical protein
VEPTAAEIRVLGSLIEKQRTTPDAYPLTLNALRLACNQSTNRDPVVTYEEAEVRDAAQRLRQRGWVRFASGPGSRAAKYRHLLADALGLAREETAILCVLMLRGPQTPGELKQRTERLHPFGSLAEVEDVLGRLASRELVVRLGRRPGQKEDRYAQVLGGGEPDGAASPEAAAGAPAAARDVHPVAAESPPDDLRARVDALERAVADLGDQLAALRRELGA